MVPLLFCFLDWYNGPIPVSFLSSWTSRSMAYCTDSICRVMDNYRGYRAIIVAHAEPKWVGSVQSESGTIADPTVSLSLCFPSTEEPLSWVSTWHSKWYHLPEWTCFNTKHWSQSSFSRSVKRIHLTEAKIRRVWVLDWADLTKRSSSCVELQF